MASIFPRHNKDGSITYRVQIRRKGLKPFITSFPSKEEAEDFVDSYEEIYCLDSENFKFDKLKRIRMNGFARKKAS